ncbi:MAG TPA: hypothetical protein VNA19_08705 [Pyrinomonadaceae bacterium]|jgi:hypothetical protein|nr:hypothetical protein [Pyrinomonadaceae bacterium]
MVLLLALILSFTSPVAASQKNSEKNKETPAGTPVLWREPSDIAGRNLLLGPGGAAMRPDTRSLSFIKQETGGFSTKYRVRDGSGREWVAKVGKEAQSETAAVRLLWAVGYLTEINYLVSCASIKGAPHDRKKHQGACGAGEFENVRLEARPEAVERLDAWKWKENPFVGTKELQGLIVMMALLNNWDIKDTNNKILLVRRDEGERPQLHYIISDLGATFGKVKLDVPGFWRLARSRNTPKDYADDSFIEDVKNGQVFFFYKGKNQDLFDDINIEEAKWIGGWLARLSDEQIADAFRAANYSPEEVRVLTQSVRARIEELARLPVS